MSGTSRMTLLDVREQRLPGLLPQTPDVGGHMMRGSSILKSRGVSPS
jgi:hypothetical protein